MEDLKRDTTAQIRAAVENFFERDKIKHRPFDEHDVASAAYSVETKFKHARVFFHAHEDKLLIRIVIPLHAGEEERLKVAEFLLRANYGLQIGCFDFDFDDGEISYRVSMFCGEEDFAPPTCEQIDYAVNIGLNMIEQYGDALFKVLFGLVEPEDAIEDAEKDD